jgi:hypothetical protein
MAAPKGKKGPGRPTLYTEAVAAMIIDGLSAGTPLAEICRGEGMPHRNTVQDWKTNNPEFSVRFARARAAGFDAIAQRARMTARGKKEEEGGDSTGDVQRDKLIIDTDLKLLAKWDPKRYGEKYALVGGDEGDAPIKTVKRIERVIIDPANRDA